jgi:uncharacterized caspase-like protein
MCDLVKQLNYETDTYTGEVKGQKMRDVPFFRCPNTRADDTLLFYYSGHGIPDQKGGEVYLATSDINSMIPMIKGISFNDLTNLVETSNSERIITLLDCCYSGSFRLAKTGAGETETMATTATRIIEEKSNKYDIGRGKFLLAASAAKEEAYPDLEQAFSLFTHYLIEGLGGKAVDINGNVTPEQLRK